MRIRKNIARHDSFLLVFFVFPGTQKSTNTQKLWLIGKCWWYCDPVVIVLLHIHTFCFVFAYDFLIYDFHQSFSYRFQTYNVKKERTNQMSLCWWCAVYFWCNGINLQYHKNSHSIQIQIQIKPTNNNCHTLANRLVYCWNNNSKIIRKTAKAKLHWKSTGIEIESNETYSIQMTRRI